MKKIKNWKWVRVKDVLITFSGGTPSTTKREYWENGTVPWINSGALKDSVINVPSTYISDLGLARSSSKVFPKNTVVVALTGATTGRVGLLDFPCATNQSIVGLYPSEYLLPKFIFYYFLAIREEIVSQAIGSAQVHINKGIIDNTYIPILPQVYQKRVIALIDKFLEKLDNVTQKSNDIENLEVTALRNYLYDGTDLFPPVKLGEYCEERRERIGKKWRNKLLIGVSKELGITKLRLFGKSSYEKYKIVMPGDFIYNPMRVDIGSVAIWQGKELALTSPDYIVFFIKNTLSPLLLFKFLKSPLGLNEINNNTQGSVRSRLYFRNLSNINFPFCGMDLQKEAESILQSFETMKLECETIKENLIKVKSETFYKAFSGKLINPGSQFEAGESLLKRILKERTKIELLISEDKKSKLPTMAKPKIELLTLIEESIGERRFTFDELHKKSQMDYESLKVELYKLMDKHVFLEFDRKKETMYLKFQRK